MSAVRSLLDGQLPAIGKGGSLTQLGGTYILNGGNGKPEPEVLFEHIDTVRNKFSVKLNLTRKTPFCGAARMYA